MQDEELQTPREITFIPAEMQRKGFVVLPFNETQFRDFMKSLLGRPQTITKRYKATFEIDKDNIFSLYHLLCQRIAQQNEGILAQFTVMTVYTDNSSVELNSLEEFMTYNEVRPVVSSEVHLAWDFLVRFQDKQNIEKQHIEVSFDTFAGGREAGFISFRIEHTARTWGTDIEALLKNYIEKRIKKPSRLKQFIRDHSTGVIFGITVIVIIAAFVGYLESLDRAFYKRLAELDQLIQTTSGSNIESISKKIDQITVFIARTSWSSNTLKWFFVPISIVALLLVIAEWLNDYLVLYEPSFVLFTEEAKADKEQTLKRLQRQWLRFTLFICLDIVVGIASNVVFALWFN